MRTKPDIQQAIVLREAGWTLASITERTLISVSTLYREFKKLDIARGSITKDTLGHSVRQELLERSGLVGDLKTLISAQINDDLSLARQLRIGLTLAIDELINDSATPASLKSRSYAAIAVSLKASSDLMRRALQIDDSTTTVSSIPILTIRKMNDDDIKAAQSKLDDDDDDDELESLSDDLLLTTI